ncbi:Regulator of chromosome condensation [Globisporangium polare]
MNSSRAPTLLLVALSVLVTGTAVLLASISADHVVSISINVPLWLTQLRKFATEVPFAGLGSRDQVTRAARKRPAMRASHDNRAPERGGDDRTKIDVWRKLSELLDDLASRGFSPFSSDQSGSAAAPLGSYDMWRDEEGEDSDDPAKDSDACDMLYRDSKQRQVCVISI